MTGENLSNQRLGDIEHTVIAKDAVNGHAQVLVQSDVEGHRICAGITGRIRCGNTHHLRAVG